MPLTISHAKSNTVADFTGTVVVHNSTGGQVTVNATDLVRPVDWNSSHVYTLAPAASEVASLFGAGSGLYMTTSAGGISFGDKLGSIFEPFPLHNTNSTNSAPGLGTWYLDPFYCPDGLDSGHIRIFMSQGVSSAIFQNGAIFTTNSTGSVSRYQTLYNRFAIYKQGTGTATSRLETVWTGACDLYGTQVMAVTTSTNSSVNASHYATLSIPFQFDASGGSTYSTYTGSGTIGSTTTTTIAASIGSTALANARNYVTGPFMPAFGFATTLEPGMYYMAHMFSSTSSTTGTNYGAGTIFSTGSVLGLLENNLVGYKQIGVSSTNTLTQAFPWHGHLATTTSGASAVMASSDIRGTTGRMYWVHMAMSLT